MSSNIKKEYILIPRKLLETIYTDYLFYENIYLYDLEEEIIKQQEKNSMDENKNTPTETINKIKYYLTREE